jgi:hypothetical protein
VTPAVTRHRSTSVHSRISYTSDQLDRLTPPSPSPSPSTPHVGTNRAETDTADQADTGVNNQFVQPGETDQGPSRHTESLSSDEDDEQYWPVATACRQTLNDRFQRHPSDDEDDNEDPPPDTRSISSNSSLGKRSGRRRADRGSGSARRKLKKQWDEAAQELLRLRGGAGNSGSKTATMASTLNLEQQFDELDTAATNWECGKPRTKQSCRTQSYLMG